MSERRKFTDYEKKPVDAKGNGRCAICGKPIDFNKMTIDHKIPLSKGGTNEISNLQPSCLGCNLMKADFTVTELAEQITNILRYHRRQKIKNMFLRNETI